VHVHRGVRVTSSVPSLRVLIARLDLEPGTRTLLVSAPDTAEWSSAVYHWAACVVQREMGVIVELFGHEEATLFDPGTHELVPRHRFLNSEELRVFLKRMGGQEMARERANVIFWSDTQARRLGAAVGEFVLAERRFVDGSGVESHVMVVHAPPFQGIVAPPKEKPPPEEKAAPESGSESVESDERSDDTSDESVAVSEEGEF